jgi:RNA polymerase sigma factor (sigma-70 family)
VTIKKTSAKVNISDYLTLVERVAKVEYRRIPSHMVDYEELVSIGALAIQALLKNKSEHEVARLNTSYIATATRWAIRNELRSRYKWYTLKKPDNVTEEAGTVELDEEGNPIAGTATSTVREAVYQTILSIEGMQEGADGESNYDFIADQSATPEEQLEITELGRAIKKAIESLPPKERTIMEHRFYRNMQVKDIATMVGLSSSRITRIVQASLNTVREALKAQDHYLE